MSFSKRKRKIFIVTASVLLALVIAVGACAIYLGDFYRAAEGAIAVFQAEENITVSVSDNGNVIFAPQNAACGLIFYPGGKVEHRAYEPLLAELAREGVLCVLVKMPFNLAVFDVNAADGIREEYPGIEKWYMGGHSLGGSMAASYLAKNAEDYEGLLLLGSYSTADLSATDLDVLSVYGSEDRVMNREKYEANKSNLPADFTEIVIDGGCHAYFGMYGAQDGDGEPTISNREQIVITATEFVRMIRENASPAVSYRCEPLSPALTKPRPADCIKNEKAPEWFGCLFVWRYLCTLPLPSPPASFFTSSTLTWL